MSDDIKKGGSLYKPELSTDFIEGPKMKEGDPVRLPCYNYGVIENGAVKITSRSCGPPKIAVYAGSFDPITNGHIDIIKRAAGLFNKLFIVVAVNSAKKSLFPLDARVRLVKKSILELKLTEKIQVKTLPDGQMLVDFAKQLEACAMIRGLRPVQDFPGEFALASINRRVAPTIETVMLVTDPSVAEVSSSMVKELVALGGPYEQFVPVHVEKALRTWKESQNES